eukprot:974848_1
MATCSTDTSSEFGGRGQVATTCTGQIGDMCTLECGSGFRIQTMGDEAPSNMVECTCIEFSLPNAQGECKSTMWVGATCVKEDQTNTQSGGVSGQSNGERSEKHGFVVDDMLSPVGMTIAIGVLFLVIGLVFYLVRRMDLHFKRASNEEAERKRRPSSRSLSRASSVSSFPGVIDEDDTQRVSMGKLAKKYSEIRLGITREKTATSIQEAYANGDLEDVESNDKATSIDQPKDNIGAISGGTLSNPPDIFVKIRGDQEGLKVGDHSHRKTLSLSTLPADLFRKLAAKL